MSSKLLCLGVWNLSVDGHVLPLFFPRGGTTLHRRPPPRCSPISPPGPPVTRGQYLCTLLTGMWIYARPLYYASCRPPCKTGMPGTVVPARHATRIYILDELVERSVSRRLNGGLSIEIIELSRRDLRKRFC